MNRTFQTAVVLLLSCAVPAAAQDDSAQTSAVTGVGSAELEKTAGRMHVVVPLTAQGKDIQEAAETMQEKLAAARLLLSGLGAEEKTVRSGPLKLDSGQTDTHREMIMHLSGSLRPHRSEADPAEQMNEMVMVRQLVTADWPLKGEGIELLAMVHSLKKKISETTFDDNSETIAKLSPEEQELLEEAQMFGESDDEDPDQPNIFFTATITEAEREELMKKAFQKARQAAERLAAASGTKLGKLVLLRDGNAAQNEWASYAYMEQYGQTSVAALQDFRAQDQDPDLQKTGTEHTGLTFRFSVTVGYEIAE